VDHFHGIKAILVELRLAVDVHPGIKYANQFAD
jgi:hypothetical protein